MTFIPRARARCSTCTSPSMFRFIRSMLIWIWSCPTSRPNSSTRSTKVAVGTMRTPAFATASRSASVAKSVCMIQSTPAARVEAEPLEWIATRALRRWASLTTAAISSFEMVWTSPDRLSAILMKSTPCLHCRRGVGENADGVLWRAYPGRFFVLYRAIGYDHAAGTVHARAFDETEFDGVSNGDVREPSPARHGDAGHAGPEHLLGVPGCAQGIEFRPGCALASVFAR